MISRWNLNCEHAFPSLPSSAVFIYIFNCISLRRYDGDDRVPPPCRVRRRCAACTWQAHALPRARYAIAARCPPNMSPRPGFREPAGAAIPARTDESPSCVWVRCTGCHDLSSTRSHRTATTRTTLNRLSSTSPAPKGPVSPRSSSSSSSRLLRPSPLRAQ